jgi:hypothetical protein
MKIANYSKLKQMMDNDPYLFQGLTKDREVKFKKWLPNNMHIYNAFIKYANELKWRSNRTYYSARAIWERLRWETMLEDSTGDCKISDLNMPFVSWLSMEAEPDLKGMFKKRRTKAIV